MMNSLLKKRLPGILVAGLLALAVGAVGAAPATASDASSSALTGKQKRAKKRALKKCNKKRSAKRTRACKRHVRKKYRRISKRNKNHSRGKTWQVDVADPYVYLPNFLKIKVNDSIRWNWKKAGGREPHDVTATSVPNRVDRMDYRSALTSDPNYTFKRKFTRAGNYSFACSIHFQMTMDVKVRR